MPPRTTVARGGTPCYIATVLPWYLGRGVQRRALRPRKLQRPRAIVATTALTIAMACRGLRARESETEKGTVTYMSGMNH